MQNEEKSIDRACYVNILPNDTPCDRSDLTCLNTDYQNSNLNILMEIKGNLSFTHIVRDSHGFIFAVEIADL